MGVGRNWILTFRSRIGRSTFIYVVSGLGFALCYTPAIVMVGCYFHERKALAYGIAMSGSGIGTFVLAPVVQLLIELYSWRGALLVLSAFVANLCVCGALLRPVTIREVEEETQPAGEEKHGGYTRTECSRWIFKRQRTSRWCPSTIGRWHLCQLWGQHQTTKVGRHRLSVRGTFSTITSTIRRAQLKARRE